MELQKIKDIILDLLKRLNKIPTMGKFAFVLAILLIISMFAFNRKIKEGFTHATDYLLKEGTETYDGFYASIYDALVYNDVKNQYEIGEIINKTSPTEESIILDIGSGTGHHVGKLNEKGYKAYGLDSSPSMIEEAKHNYPKSKFINGNALDNMVIPSDSVTHILCLNSTIYDFSDKQTFFQNCMEWLMPGGILALHLVNRERFDPTINNSKQKDFIEIPHDLENNPRPTETRSKFDKYDYKGRFEMLSNDISEYKEVFVDNKTGKIRQNNHKYYMETQKQILNIAMDTGFIVDEQINLSNVGYNYQFIYILQKPN